MCIKMCVVSSCPCDSSLAAISFLFFSSVPVSVMFRSMSSTLTRHSSRLPRSRAFSILTSTHTHTTHSHTHTSAATSNSTTTRAYHQNVIDHCKHNSKQHTTSQLRHTTANNNNTTQHTQHNTGASTLQRIRHTADVQQHHTRTSRPATRHIAITSSLVACTLHSDPTPTHASLQSHHISA